MSDVIKVASPQPLSLGSIRMKAAQSVRNVWSVSIPHGTEPKALLDKSYWKHHAAALKPLDLIEAICEDGTWEMWLRVIKPEPPAAVHVSKIFESSHADIKAGDDKGDFTVEWRGPVAKFCVVRTSNGEVVSKDHYPRAIADAALAQLKSRAA